MTKPTEHPERPTRYQVPLRIIYDAGEDGFWTAPVVDMAELGLFVETTHELPVGSEVTITPDPEGDFDESDELPFELKGEVVRVKEFDDSRLTEQPHGMAFKLKDITEDDRAMLVRFMERYGTADDA